MSLTNGRRPSADAGFRGVGGSEVLLVPDVGHSALVLVVIVGRRERVLAAGDDVVGAHRELAAPGRAPGQAEAEALPLGWPGVSTTWPTMLAPKAPTPPPTVRVLLLQRSANAGRLGRRESAGPWPWCRRSTRRLRGRCSSGRRRSGRSDRTARPCRRPAQPSRQGVAARCLRQADACRRPAEGRAGARVAAAVSASGHRRDSRACSCWQGCRLPLPRPFLQSHSRPSESPASRPKVASSEVLPKRQRAPASASVGGLEHQEGLELAAGVVPDRKHASSSPWRDRRLRSRARCHAKGEQQGKWQLQAARGHGGQWTEYRRRKFPGRHDPNLSRFMFI